MSAPADLGILHVDMDAFYASVEQRRRPELKGLPVVVGGQGGRGVVAAASYEARHYGVYSAMPSTQAQRLCPDAVFLPGDHAHYAEVSKDVMAILREYTPLVEPLSLDEAFLDVRGVRRLHGEPVDIARAIRREVHSKTGLTCSIGVSAIKFLAKLATEHAKPKASKKGPVFGPGVFVVPAGQELEFLQPLPARALWGVGPKTLERLERLGVVTIGDIAALPLQTAISTLGKSQGRHLHELANAIDNRSVEPDQQMKSVSHEETFAHDVHERPKLEREIVRMADAVANRLRKGGWAGRTVTVKLRFGSFETITRSVTLPDPVDTSPGIARAAKGLFAAIDPTPGVRLLGVGVTGLVDGNVRQLTLEDAAVQPRSQSGNGPSANGRPWADASEALDQIRDRFGDDAIGPATLAVGGKVKVFRTGEQQWGPDE